MQADPQEIVRTGDRLLAAYPELFTEQYAANERVVERLVGMESFRSRSRLTGYITREKRAQDATG
ncbi:30S ribosomal protein S17 [Haloarcula salina]|uniref:30S ribosomal protein S17 n=1 Tax=Haloarcula salina TaxID=1429914 RepID=A0AA41G215_9EURY|nr:30S ribosomal protein S17 [Haloarcula salina]MBV0902760.1 30S ribosomal protein S17 [Haloarcula salina]